MALAPYVILCIPFLGTSVWGGSCGAGVEGDRMSFDVLVIGLGYVGLPLAHEAAFSGLKVAGYDVNRPVSVPPTP